MLSFLVFGPQIVRVQWALLSSEAHGRFYQTNETLPIMEPVLIQITHCTVGID